MTVVGTVKDWLVSRRHAYIQTFDNPYGEKVLKDLAGFCRAKSSTFNKDPRHHALLEGRREVWLRISAHLNLTEEELFEKFK